MKKQEDSPEVKIRIWMIRNNLNRAKIAKGYGCNRQFVYQIIHGLKTSKGLVAYMIDRGCPEECFKNGKLAEK